MALAPAPDEGEEREADPEDSKVLLDLEDKEASAGSSFSGESMTSRAKKPSAVPASMPIATRIGDFMMKGGSLDLPGNYVSESHLYQDAARSCLGLGKKSYADSMDSIETMESPC